jgi:hypothetical protein
LKYSSGALVGGLAVAFFGLLSINYGIHQKGKWNENKIESTSRAMAEVGYASVERIPDENLAEKTRMNFVGLENSAVELETEKAGAVKVRAKPESVSTSILLTIGPFRANVYSADSTEPDYEILTGTVHNYSKDFIEIKADDSSKTKPVKINLTENSERLMRADLENNNEAKLQGMEVKVLYVPRSSQAIKLSLLRGAAPRVIYNADSASLTMAAAMVPQN